MTRPQVTLTNPIDLSAWDSSATSLEASATEGIDDESLQAISSTLSFLQPFSDPKTSSQLHAGYYPVALVSSTSGSPSTEAKSFLQYLLKATTETAINNACSSFVAGPSSESDEYGDVGFWLGPGDLGKGHEEDVIKALGFEKLLENGKMHESNTPILSKEEPAKAQLSQLADVHSFRIEGGPDRALICFLVARRSNNDWVGIVGIGTST